MSFAGKLRLENSIFARAQVVRSAVYAQDGGLFAPAQDAILQTLLFHYNVCYRAENFRQFCLPRTRWIQPQYIHSRPGCMRVYYMKEIRFEWINI